MSKKGKYDSIKRTKPYNIKLMCSERIFEGKSMAESKEYPNKLIE
jgi:hypothetical protein